ncbi:MAG: N-acetyl-gamma-glutamyl-phosphate reductase [Oscillospiraceae bacterium]|nr:N-acetyl-gamma-glutamyl-phosphate reductase [Oscillospiraceae bacterium]
MKPKVYIDGKEGTTGLQIYQRLGSRRDIDLLLIDEDKRKDVSEREKLINAADVVFLCLPDDAAREAVTLVHNDATRIIDASTAHRTAPGWDYGLPELSAGHRAAIAASRRVANPGCHASGFIACTYPLVHAGILPADYPLTCYSLTGYSGGGKKLIAEYEDPDRDTRHDSHRIYGTNLRHKHLPEMVSVCGLKRAPVFSPILGDFYCGMATTIMLHNDLLAGRPDAAAIRKVLTEHYAGQRFVTVAPLGGDESVIYASTNAGTNNMRLIVCGNGEQTTVTALFDNLGKGASGAAVQNMNIMLGLDEATGLVKEGE